MKFTITDVQIVVGYQSAYELMPLSTVSAWIDERVLTTPPPAWTRNAEPERRQAVDGAGIGAGHVAHYSGRRATATISPPAKPRSSSREPPPGAGTVSV